MDDPLLFYQEPRWKRGIIFRLLILQRSQLVPMSLRRWLLNRMGAEIHPTATISYNFRIVNPRILKMAAKAYFNAGCYVDGGAMLEIGEGARIGSNSTILTSRHKVGPHEARCGHHSQSTHHPVRIGRGCWLGAHVIVLPGVDIAPGCIIAAQALVTRDTEPDGLYVNMAGDDGVVNARRFRNLP
jgi:maltose O-acetyltransferase